MTRDQHGRSWEEIATTAGSEPGRSGGEGISGFLDRGLPGLSGWEGANKWKRDVPGMHPKYSPGDPGGSLIPAARVFL